MITSGRCMYILLLALAMTGFVSPTARADDDSAVINVSWISTPTNPLPPELRTIRVQKPSYRCSDVGAGIIGSMDEMWYRQLLTEIDVQLSRHAPHITRLDLEDRGQREDIEDDQRAGGTIGGPAQRRELQPDVLIIPRFQVAIVDQPFNKENDMHKRLVSRWLRLGDPAREIGWVRNVTVSCDIEMTTYSTGAQLNSYTGTLVHHEETENGIFGYHQVSRAEFEPVAPIIHDFCSQHVRAFMSQFVAVEQTLKVELEDVKSRNRQAIAELNNGNFKRAAETAKRVWIRSKNRDDQAAFVAGLACEFMGELDWASTWYQKAIGREDEVIEYQEGLDRVTQHSSDPGTAQHAPLPGLRQSSSHGEVRIVNDRAGAAVSADTAGSVSGTGVSDCPVDLPPELLGALKKAGELRALQGEKPYRTEDLFVEAVEQWLQREHARRQHMGGAETSDSSATP